MKRLWAKGVRSVLCEGGSKLATSLIGAGLVDDVFLTIAPMLAGGSEQGVVSGAPLDMAVDMPLAHVAERNGSLFVRWSRS
jgi:riboflavin biosynthesis pyrimidine reductase